FYAGLCTLLVLFLAIRVARWRYTHKIGLGDGGDRELLKRVRAHGNAVEYLPLCLILLGGMELNGYSAPLLHGFGIALVISRLAHAWGVSRSAGSSAGRMAGMAVTWGLMIAMAAFAIGGYAMQYYVAPGA
ncbi:MAG: MAPEG family protein, partial [Arenimonas sp.]